MRQHAVTSHLSAQINRINFVTCKGQTANNYNNLTTVIRQDGELREGADVQCLNCGSLRDHDLYEQNIIFGFILFAKNTRNRSIHVHVHYAGTDTMQDKLCIFFYKNHSDSPKPYTPSAPQHPQPPTPTPHLPEATCTSKQQF